MLSPNGPPSKALAPSIWSYDSGYASSNFFGDEEELGIDAGVSSSPSEQQQVNERGLGLSNLWNVQLGEHLHFMRDEPAIEPIVTKLSVFTTRDNSDSDFYLPEISSDGESCVKCEFWRITNPNENIRCEDCRIPEIIEPTSSLLANGPKGKQPMPSLQIPQELKGKDINMDNGMTRCSACELNALINPARPSLCASCSPQPGLLSPPSPTPSDSRVRRSQARRNSKLPLSALNRLQAWLNANEDNPYPSSEVKRQLARDCNITERQVTTWFTNARARQLSPIETYLQSGSEDEAAQESDIVSAAQTPTYDPRLCPLPAPTQSGYRRAGSVSGSSVFSQGKNRPHPSRRGKKKTYRRRSSNQSPQIAVPGFISSGQPTPFSAQPFNPEPKSAIVTSPATEQDTWQCTFCHKHLVPKSWRRHEETQHLPRSQWTCMLGGPRISIPTRGTFCAFCMAKDTSEEHFHKHHRINECLKRKDEERTFNRPDHLRQHVKNFHNATLYDAVQARWKKTAEGKPGKTKGINGIGGWVSEGDGGFWYCGFCGDKLDTWDKREMHYANHFKDGFTMAQWSDPTPLPTPVSTTESKLKLKKWGSFKSYKDKENTKKREHEEERQKEEKHHGGFDRFIQRITGRPGSSYGHQSHAQPPVTFSNFLEPIPTTTTAPMLSPYSTAQTVCQHPVLPELSVEPFEDPFPNWHLDPNGFDISGSVAPYDPTQLREDFNALVQLDMGNLVEGQGPWAQGDGNRDKDWSPQQ